MLIDTQPPRKLTQILRSLSPADWERLRRFAASPYFNQDEARRRLLDQWATVEAEPAAEALFAQVFPGELFDSKRLNYLLHDALRLVEEFLALEQWRQAPGRSLAYVLARYAEPGWERHFRAVDRRLDKLAEALPAGEPERAHLRFLQSQVRNRYFLGQDQQAYDAALQDTSDALDEYYLLQKVRILAEMKDRQQRRPEAYDAGSVRAVEALLTHFGERGGQSATLSLYWEAIRMLSSPLAVKPLLALLNSIRHEADAIQVADRQTLRQLAINQCVRGLGQGLPLREALFDLYQDALLDGDLLEKDVLSFRHYKNIIFLGLSLHRIAEIESFIEDYTPKLLPPFRKDAYEYNMAVVHYTRRDYDAAMEHLRRVEFTDLSYKLWSKELLLKIYYETGEFTALESLLASFEILLRRNRELTGVQKRPYLNFIRLLRKLLHPRVKRDRLAREIERQVNLRERQWLLAKCEE